MRLDSSNTRLQRWSLLATLALVATAAALALLPSCSSIPDGTTVGIDEAGNVHIIVPGPPSK